MSNNKRHLYNHHATKTPGHWTNEGLLRNLEAMMMRVGKQWDAYTVDLDLHLA